MKSFNKTFCVCFALYLIYFGFSVGLWLFYPNKTFKYVWQVEKQGIIGIQVLKKALDRP